MMMSSLSHARRMRDVGKAIDAVAAAVDDIRRLWSIPGIAGELSADDAALNMAAGGLAYARTGMAIYATRQILKPASDIGPYGDVDVRADATAVQITPASDGVMGRRVSL